MARASIFLAGSAVCLLLSCEGTQREYPRSETGSVNPAPDERVRVDQPGDPQGPTSNPETSAEQPAPRSSSGSGMTAGTTASEDAGTGCEFGSDGGCQLPCAGCSILGICVGSGVANPDNPCQVCDPLRNTSEWSNEEGTLCEDGQFCTVDDACSSGQCAGIARQCDDGVACNGIGRCDENTNTCVPGTPQCPSTATCDTATAQCVTSCAGCVIAGSCVANGGEEPSNPCRVCDTEVSRTAYTPVVGKSCGAGSSECSLQDTCDAAGTCQPNPAPVGSPCGSNATSQCDQPDSCNAQGQCIPNNLARGARCGVLPASCARPDQCDGAGSCQSRAAERSETCDGTDDDCDGATDEGFNLSTDPNNCGACGRACSGGIPCTNGICALPLRVPGAQCTTGGQCQSGVCTGGACCAGPCSGVCSTCQQGTGACVALDDRTPCGPMGSHQRCSAGTCSLPTVLCGGVNQQVTATSACCEILGDAAGLRETFTTRASCPSSVLDFDGLTTTPITCDNAADCPSGELCCLRSAGDSAIECTPQAACTTLATTQYQVCSSPQGVVASCQEGSCTPFFLGGFVTGWGFCQ